MMRQAVRAAIGVGGLTAAAYYFTDQTHEGRFRQASGVRRAGRRIVALSLWLAFQKEYLRIAHSDTLAELNKRPTTPLPSRQELLRALREQEYDVLIIGGGATGAGVALDSQTRGFSVSSLACTQVEIT
jgi:hypothetical protein